jgi:hypothetical protein
VDRLAEPDSSDHRADVPNSRHAPERKTNWT